MHTFSQFSVTANTQTQGRVDLLGACAPVSVCVCVCVCRLPPFVCCNIYVFAFGLVCVFTT